jgi:hypothetical protein
VFSSTFTGNLATRGGAIGVGGGDLLVDNSTISGNQTDLEGGAGVYAAGTGYMSIAYSTITNNSITNAVSDFRGWGAGIRVYGGTPEPSSHFAAADWGPNCAKNQLMYGWSLTI